MKEQPNSQTAYQHNAHSSSTVEQVNDHGWADAINRMIDQRYAFLALKYENDGYLFRGMRSGFFDALFDNEFWHYSGEDSGNHFEKELDVLLLSQDFSDAFTVSKLWEQKLDACIIIFKSEIFNKALNEKKAAMMATAEPGVVFKYPFLSYPLALEEIDYLVVSTDLLNAITNQNSLAAFDIRDDSKFNKLFTLVSELYSAGKLLFLDNTKENYHRSSFEQALKAYLSKRNIVGAKTINSDIKPVRKI